MGGLGSRFRNLGYTLSKPAIPVFDRHSGREMPMVIAAMKDMLAIGGADTRFICVDQAEHAASGLETEIRRQFPATQFVHDHARLGQAFACLLAREYLLTDEELIIASCDAGIAVDLAAFEARKAGADALMFSHSNDQNIEANPLAHSWAELGPDGQTIARVSIKQPVSDTPMADHATTGFFWFRRASDFVDCLLRQLAGDLASQRECLVDHVLQRYVAEGARVSYLDVDYYCWGTPRDYEAYQLTYAYWEGYLDANDWLRTGTLDRDPVPERGGKRAGAGAADPQPERARSGRVRSHLR